MERNLIKNRKMVANMLLKVIKYDYLNLKKDVIHIGYGVDDNFMRGMMTSIVSFCLMNNKNFVFHIITYNISEANKLRLEEIAKKYKVVINVYIIDAKQFENLPVFVHLPMSMYFRFMLPILLKDVNKLIYIDADIICIKEASELFNVDLNNDIIAAVPDQNDERNSILGLNKEHIYFNSGMLVINISKWNEINFLDKAVELLKTKPEIFKFPDQDVLNIILTHKVKYLNTKFNCFVDYRNCRKPMKNEDIVLLHFSALPKPWNIAWNICKIANDFNRNLYAYYENKSPWKNIPLYEPKSYKEIAAYVKALYNNKKYIKAFIWLVKYFRVKNKFL